MVKIDNIELPDFPLLLAPMEDVSDPPFYVLSVIYRYYDAKVSNVFIVKNLHKKDFVDADVFYEP